MNHSSKICNHLYKLAQEKNGQDITLDLNGVPVLVIQNYKNADYVLRRNSANYLKKMEWFRQTLGASRFSEDGEAWRVRKELTQPFFTKFDRELTCTMAYHYAHSALDKLVHNSDSGQKTIDDDLLREMTFCVLIEVFFGVKLSDTQINIQNLAKLMEYGSEYSFVPPGKTNTLYKEKVSLLPSLFRQVLKDFNLFRTGNLPPNLMLEKLIAADKDPSNDIVLEHELLTFFAAGSETTAAAVSWICYLLASHPDMQEMLHQEATVFWQSKTHDWAHLSQLKGLTALISEALRLYPPTPIISRTSVAQDTIGKIEIPANQNILISFIGIQHDEKLFSDPWRLNIEKAKHNPHTTKGSGINTAFSFGPRVCGGKQFALVELTAFFSVFLNKAKFELTSSKPVQFYWKSQMLHEGGQPVKVSLRHK